jgi:hypothetical protein
LLRICVEGPFWAVTNLSGNKASWAGRHEYGEHGRIDIHKFNTLITSYIGWENALHVAAALSVIAAGLWLGITPAKAV